jgi:hypothetical protein
MWIFDDALDRPMLRALRRQIGRKQRLHGLYLLPTPPKNAVERAIQRLHAFARPSQQCAAAEWWVNRLEPSAAFPFHFDKNERVFSRERRFVHPERASVFYLSDEGGPTRVLRCTPEALDGAQTFEGRDCHPRVNRYLVFDGDLLHGVVPAEAPCAGLRVTLLVNWWSVTELAS